MQAARAPKRKREHEAREPSPWAEEWGRGDRSHRLEPRRTGSLLERNDPRGLSRTGGKDGIEEVTDETTLVTTPVDGR
jgi:hypothetical protein